MGCTSSSTKHSDKRLNTLRGFPPNVYVDGEQCFVNGDESIFAVQPWIATPMNEGHVVEIVNWAYSQGWKLRPVGSGSTNSPLVVIRLDHRAVSDFTNEKVMLIDMRRYMRNQTTATLQGTTVTKAQPGVDIASLLRGLQSEGVGDIGYGLASGPRAGDRTLGGMLAVNGHGTAVPLDGEAKHLSRGQAPIYGTLSNRVLAVRAIVWDEESKSYTAKEFKRSDGSALPFLTQLGRSILTEVTLQVEKNYYLRCQYVMNVHWEKVFAAVDPRTNDPPPDSMVWHLRKCGRVEALWYPYTEYPQLKVLSVTDEVKPSEAKEITQPVQFETLTGYSEASIKTMCAESAGFIKSNSKRFASFGFLDGFVAKLQDELDSATAETCTTRLLPQVMWLHQLTELANSDLFDIWGQASVVLRHIAPLRNCPRFTTSGYVILTSDASLSNCIRFIATTFHSIVNAFSEAEGKYPVDGPLKIRVTGVDDASAVDDAAPPLSSACFDATLREKGWNRAVWVSVLSVVRSEVAGTGPNEFYAAMETKLLDSEYNGIKGLLRPQWGKGWGYTDKGPWTNNAFINQTRASLPRWNETIAALDKYDPHKVFTNPWLEKLMVPVDASGAPTTPAPLAGSTLA